jgi:hypothetical protein
LHVRRTLARLRAVQLGDLPQQSPRFAPGVSGQGCAPMHAQHVQPTGQRTFGSVKRVQPLRP